MAGEGRRRKRRVSEEIPQLTDKEARERTMWLMFHYDLQTGKYIDGVVPPWEQAQQQEGERHGAD